MGQSSLCNFAVPEKGKAQTKMHVLGIIRPIRQLRNGMVATILTAWTILDAEHSIVDLKTGHINQQQNTPLFHSRESIVAP